MGPRLALVALALGAAGALGFAACGGDPIYVFQGQRFDPARGCLEHPTALDVVEGPTTPKECPAVCLVQAGSASQDGGKSTYVAFTCPPYPPGFEAAGSDPTCAPALAAAARKDGCLPEAGAPDASGDSAAADAGTDADADAPSDVGAATSADTSPLDADDG